MQHIPSHWLSSRMSMHWMSPEKDVMSRRIFGANRKDRIGSCQHQSWRHDITCLGPDSASRKCEIGCAPPYCEDLKPYAGVPLTAVHRRTRLKIALVRSYLRVPQAAGQVKILIFLVKINFFPSMPIIFALQGKCLF